MVTSKKQLGYEVKSFKGRRLNVRKPVQVHRNLHGNTWSISQDRRVVATAESLTLTGAVFKVSNAGWARSIAQERRNVHAFVIGKLRPNDSEAGYEPARYDRQNGRFRRLYDGHEISTAVLVKLDRAGMRVSQSFSGRS